MNLEYSRAYVSSASDGRPNLLIVGAQKAGTTLLATRLARHPDIYLPPQKEMNFFTDSNWSLKSANYLAHYSNHRNTLYRLDATPGYFWTSRANKEFDDRKSNSYSVENAIYNFLGPETRILIILRHPTRRAVSAFFHHFRMGRISTRAKIRNLLKFKGIVDMGFYSEHLSNYFAIFPEDKVKVLFIEEYSKDMLSCDLGIYQWLGLDQSKVDNFVAPQDNINFKTEVSNNAIRLCSGIEQVLNLIATDSRFQKMAPVDPPCVEQEDLEILNKIYYNEITKMYAMFPKVSGFWKLNLSLSDF